MKISFVVMLTACMSLGCIVSAAKGNDKEARRKARYYYTAGSVAKASGQDREAYEYYKKAYKTDPNYEEAATAYGLGRLTLPIDTLQSDTELNRSLSMMRAYVDKYPDDMYEAQYYGFINTQLGETEEAIRVLERTADRNPSYTSTLVALADAYANSDNLKKAAETLARYEQAEGMNPQITTRKLSYLLADKDTTGALREVSRLHASDPSSVPITILKGNVFDIIEQPDSALYYYQLAEKIDPESGNAKLALAGYYQQNGDSVAYDNKMYEVLLSADLDLDTKIELLAQYLQTLLTNNQLSQRGDHLFEVTRNQYPHEPRLLDLGARYSAAKQDFTEAEDQISYAIDLDPTNATYWGQLMTYQMADQKPQDGLATYERALDHIAPDEGLQMLRAIMAQQAKRFDLAADIYRGFIDSIQPGLNVDSVLTLGDVRRDITADELDRLSRLIAQLGDIYHEAGDSEKSYMMYDNALTFDPSNAMAANNYAYFLCTEGGNLEKAEALSQQSLSGKDADNPTYLDTYAWIQYMKGNYAIARQFQEKAIEQMEKDDDGSADLYIHYGDIKEKLGEMEDAVKAWQKGVEIMEKNEATDEEQYKETLNKINKANR